jgi:hypothetical protein
MLPAHHLLLTQAATLPQDLRDDIAGLREAFGDMLAPGLGKFALMLLDDPDLPLEEAEEYIALKAARLSAPSQAAPCETAAPCAIDRAPESAPERTRFPLDSPKSALWASTALQHHDFETSLARAGP